MDDVTRKTQLVMEHAGLALYHAQVFEEGLGWFLQACAYADGKLDTEEQRRILEESLRAKTLGALLRLVKTRLIFGAEAEGCVNQALADRNILAHDFFKQCGVEWVRGEKRDEMIERLKNYQEHCRKAGRVIQAHAKPIYREIGFTEQVFAGIACEIFKNA